MTIERSQQKPTTINGDGISNVERVLYKFARAADMEPSKAPAVYNGDDVDGVNEATVSRFWNAIGKHPGGEHVVGQKVQEALELDELTT